MELKIANLFPVPQMAAQHDQLTLERRPGILIVGSPNVGKRSLLSRLVSVDLSEASDLPSDTLCYGWTIDTKYYTADLAIWVAHLGNGCSDGKLPSSDQLAALVMVFDLSDLSSFKVIQDWVAGIDIQKFEILLCVGNKADLLSGHFAHSEYRRRLQKCGESSSDPHPEYLDYGIHETEGSSLLGDEEPSFEIRRSYLEWCVQHNIEYLETCASNTNFDKCLSIDGDSQGVERLFGALSAHMWPGMILKSGNRISEPSQIAKDSSDEEESDYEIEYELLSRGSEEPWDGINESWVAFDDLPQSTRGEAGLSINENIPVGSNSQTQGTRNVAEDQTSNSQVPFEEVSEAKTNKNPVQGESGTDNTEVLMQEDSETTTGSGALLQEDSETETGKVTEAGEGKHLGLDDLEQLMCEINHMRENLRLMPDFQRKEMAAKLAMKMATMFADSDDEEAFK